MKALISIFFLLATFEQSFAQVNNSLISYRIPKQNIRQDILKPEQIFPNFTFQNFNSSLSKNKDSETSLWKEAGYILAMETVFTGLSYLASREKNYGRNIVGGVGAFMGIAGIVNSPKSNSGTKKIGHYLVSAGFIAKSLYNFKFGKKHGEKTQFLTNFIGFNALVFTGYYLDSLD